MYSSQRKVPSPAMPIIIPDCPYHFFETFHSHFLPFQTMSVSKDFSKLSLEENKENVAPRKDVTPEKTKFAAPTPSRESAAREPLSPKKGFAVNTKHMPAYMRPTAASSGRKTISKFIKTRVFGPFDFSNFILFRPARERQSSNYQAKYGSCTSPCTAEVDRAVTPCTAPDELQDGRQKY